MTCGPKSLFVVLSILSDGPVNIAQAMQALKPYKLDADRLLTPLHLSAMAKDLGCNDARITRGSLSVLCDEISKGYPAIVMLDVSRMHRLGRLSGEKKHFVVVCGYERKTLQPLFPHASPSGWKYSTCNLDSFLSGWKATGFCALVFSPVEGRSLRVAPAGGEVFSRPTGPAGSKGTNHNFTPAYLK